MTEIESGRREQVLESALVTFARFGFRKTSMEDVAQAANISRPGLYFLFSSKQSLFQAAVVHALDADVDAAERALADVRRPLRERLIEAFDLWTGRYLGPMVQEVAVLRETSPELLGPLVAGYPARFAAMVTEAIAAEVPPGLVEAVARTLISTSGGIKHEVSTREEFVERVTVAVDLLLRAGRAAG
ncbi:TetR/AcrR family transcriptional regulator [Actinoplanes friuliensis]|uniref:TetR family transcriptional regulator n=1 Tax=Actinoplanes friuliensis DSM 7358 TaxID=1246995 RepID=U5W4D4_9ACTN|nr:TetR/AcrR family transcriptional regulator [Actinoplanes friuliensis]AGZ42786.1 TetR family transcriptional regulator [Actinoplanes friuliensis DSM 7358]